MQTLEFQFACGLYLRDTLDRAANLSVDKDLTVDRLGAKPGSQIYNRAGCGIVQTPFKTDLPKRCESICNPHAETDVVAALAPGGYEAFDLFAHLDAHLYRARGRIRTA